MNGNKLSPFQMILFAVLILAIVIGVVIFAFTKITPPGSGQPVTMWGTVDATLIENLQRHLNELDRNSLQVTYSQIPYEQFESRLVEALASGIGPDLVLMSDDFFMRQENKLYLIDYKTYPEALFKTNFIEAGEFLQKREGILGLPFTIDPLVMYWNRSLLNQAGISMPPRKWDEFVSIAPQLIDRDTGSLNIRKSAVALGEFTNIQSAKEIFINLVMQAGNPIVARSRDASDREIYVAVLNERYGYSVSPSDAALNFYTQFSNPTRDFYSWNRSLPNSREMFLANDLAFYFGFASEYNELKRVNPNLNFDVAVIPQSTSAQLETVYGNVNFLGVMRTSQNIVGSLDTINKLTQPESIQFLSSQTNLPPIRRDLLGSVPDSSVQDNFNKSALIAKIFLDPDPNRTNEIFKEMIESYTSGRSIMSDAINRAQQELNSLLRR